MKNSKRNSGNKALDIFKRSRCTGNVDLFKIEGVKSVVGVQMRLKYRRLPGCAGSWFKSRSSAGEDCPLMISPLEWSR